MTLSCLSSFQSFVPFMVWNTMDICFGSEVLNIDKVRFFFKVLSVQADLILVYTNQ